MISFTSDWRFAPARSREIVNALLKADKNVTYGEIDSPMANDAFLVAKQPRYEQLFKAYMQRISV